jgi:uncharacterized protein YgbK (DUF1537 family)
VFKGYLFAGNVLLNESGMQNHPLTPMTDANLVRVMQAQTKRKVGLIDYKTVALGEAAIRERISALRAEGVGVAVVDATSNDDLHRMGPALKDMPLLTAGSGVAIGLPANFGLKPSLQASQLPAAHGLQAVVSGSCSLATNAQVAHFKSTGRPAMAINPAALMHGQSDAVVQQVLAWAAPLLKEGPVLVYSTAEPEAVKAVQAQLGVAEAGALVEHALAAVARWACSSWWWPVAKPRVLVCRHSVLLSCRSVHKSTRACLGAMHPATTAACTSRSSRATLAPKTSSPKPLQCWHEHHRIPSPRRNVPRGPQPV